MCTICAQTVCVHILTSVMVTNTSNARGCEQSVARNRKSMNRNEHLQQCADLTAAVHVQVQP